MEVSFSEFRELVIDREAWPAVIHGVAKSWTRLSDFHFVSLVNMAVLRCVFTGYCELRKVLNSLSADG